jgi:hypothetical protein
MAEQTVLAVFVDGVSNSYEHGYFHGKQDVELKNRGLTRFDLSGLYDQRYAEGYRSGQKQARKDKLTAAQKKMLVARAKEVPQLFNCMRSYPHA